MVECGTKTFAEGNASLLNGFFREITESPDNRKVIFGEQNLCDIHEDKPWDFEKNQRWPTCNWDSIAIVKD
jgi:hypothetical protein